MRIEGVRVYECEGVHMCVSWARVWGHGTHLHLDRGQFAVLRGMVSRGCGLLSSLWWVWVCCCVYL